MHEERLAFAITLSVDPPEKLIRADMVYADMVYIEKPTGGAVLSDGLDHLLQQPAGRRFRQQHPRLAFNAVKRLDELGLEWPLPQTA
ncbi:MAG: hypothetical protein JSR91_10670 [Proteobacteria bacterium]|nr:hypothetical protein [Pseudomonadota bacterium]